MLFMLNATNVAFSNGFHGSNSTGGEHEEMMVVCRSRDSWIDLQIAVHHLLKGFLLPLGLGISAFLFIEAVSPALTHWLRGDDTGDTWGNAGTFIGISS